MDRSPAGSAGARSRTDHEGPASGPFWDEKTPRMMLQSHLPAPQFPIDDFDGESRYIGFALKALNERVAFEINRSDSGPR